MRRAQLNLIVKHPKIYKQKGENDHIKVYNFELFRSHWKYLFQFSLSGETRKQDHKRS